jgi:hypothetical protein
MLGDERGKNAVLEVLGPVKPASYDEDEVNADPNSTIGRYLSVKVQAIRAAGKLKTKDAINYIILSLGDDISMSSFDRVTQEEHDASSSAKIEALKSITGKNFGYALCRWTGWWLSQGNSFPKSEYNYEEEPVFEAPLRPTD